MDKRSALVVSLLSLFLLFSFRGYADPLCSNPTNITQPIYDPISPSSFSVTCTNASSVFITIYNSTDATNVLINNDTMINNSVSNYTYSAILPAGAWNWTSYANDLDNNWNSTNTLSFNVNKAATSLNLSLNGVQGNTSFLSNNTAMFTVNLNVTGKLVNLVSNYTGLNQSDQTPFSFPSGFYSVGNWWYLTGLFLGDENYTGSNQTYYFNVTDSTPPAYSSSTIDIIIAGSSTVFRTLWTDNAGLSGYVFSFDNGNGSFINDSWIPMTGLTNWSNVTNKIINSTAGSTIRWIVYANDTSNNWNVNIGASFNTKLVDGSPCTADIQCFYNCVSNVCRQLNVCGDGHCDSAETCSFCPTDCGACQSTTTSPSTGSNTPTGSFTIKNLASSFAILQGESNSAQFTLSNTLANNLANVSVAVSGIDSSWYTLSKNFLSIVAHGSTQPVTITFNIPSDAEAKDYSVSITAAGKDILTKLLKTYTATTTLTVNSSQPQPIQPLPSETVQAPTPETVQDNSTANITSNQTVTGATGLAPAFEFFKSNLVLILAIAVCLLIFIFRDNLTTALGGTIGKEETKTKAKSVSPLKGIKDKLDYKLIVNLKKESKAKNLKETEVQGAEKIPEMVPGKEPKRPAMLEKEIKRDIRELQGIIENENKVKKNKKKLNLGNN